MDEYTTFFCEYTFKDGDIHFHFFQTADQVVPRTYWNLIFPQTLDKIAVAHFDAKFPQLQASFIEGVIRYGTVIDLEKDQSESSWWFIAQEFQKVPDPHALVASFLEKLDSALDKAIASA